MGGKPARSASLDPVVPGGYILLYPVTHPTDPRSDLAPDEEVLDELGDDAIVAQQAVHAPRRAVELEVEARTIVVADDPTALDPSEVMETRQLPQYGAGADPTQVARRAAARAPTMVLPRVSVTPPRKKRNWVVIGIWIAAGVVAFGFGGVLAAITARGGGDGKGSATAPPPPPPATAAATAAPASAPEPEPTQQPAAEPVEALSASELPVERSKRRVKRPSASATPPPRPASTTKTAPAKTEIPEGI